MKRFLVLLSLSIVACVSDPGAEPEDTDRTGSPALAETSQAASQDPEGGPVIQSLTCYQTWYCTWCGNRRRNVLREECDDGSSTVIYTGPCGQACY